MSIRRKPSNPPEALAVRAGVPVLAGPVGAGLVSTTGAPGRRTGLTRCTRPGVRGISGPRPTAVKGGGVPGLPDGRRQVVGPGVGEELLPRRDVRPAPQQCAPLTLGHSSPDAELDPVVESVGEALGTDKASEAACLDPILSRALHEKIVRIEVPAGCVGSPVAVDCGTDEGGRVHASGRWPGSQAAGHATCLSCRDRVKGPVRVVTAGLRSKPYGVTRVRDRPHSGGCRNDSSGLLPFSTDNVRCVNTSYLWRHRYVSVGLPGRMCVIARRRGCRGGSSGGSRT